MTEGEAMWSAMSSMKQMQALERLMQEHGNEQAALIAAQERHIRAVNKYNERAERHHEDGAKLEAAIDTFNARPVRGDLFSFLRAKREGAKLKRCAAKYDGKSAKLRTEADALDAEADMLKKAAERVDAAWESLAEWWDEISGDAVEIIAALDEGA